MKWRWPSRTNLKKLVTCIAGKNIIGSVLEQLKPLYIAEQELNPKAYKCKRQKLLQRENSRPRYRVLQSRRSRHLTMPSTRSPVSIRSIFTSSPTMIGKLHVSAAPCWLTSRTNVSSAQVWLDDSRYSRTGIETRLRGPRRICRIRSPPHRTLSSNWIRSRLLKSP